jgi:hypothetical protein
MTGVPVVEPSVLSVFARRPPMTIVHDFSAARREATRLSDAALRGAAAAANAPMPPARAARAVAPGTA